MFNKQLLSVMIAGLALAGCQNGALDMGGANLSPTPGTNVTPAPTLEGTEIFNDTLFGLADRGMPLECEFSQESEASMVDGTVVAANNMYRVESTINAKSDDSKVDAYVIGRDGYVYQWTPLTDQGLQVSEEALAEAGNRISGMTQGNQDLSALGGMLEDMEYSCSNWIVDESQFELPEEIQFTDISALVERFRVE
jgi:hypothetical protein